MRSSSTTKKPKYPLATIAWYGPDNTRASKVAVGVIKHPGDKDRLMNRWFSEETDVRYDQKITEEIVAFLKENQVRESAMSDRIMGCPHEEGIDYPLGGVCPKCPFWWNIDRFTHEPLNKTNDRAPAKVGRNDLCPCGSGKKFKKCCGA